MSEVHFYHNADDRLLMVCQLSRRAADNGRRLAIRVTDATQAELLDDMLWQFQATSFVAHAQIHDSALVMHSPVVIGSKPPWPHQDILINLAEDIASDSQQFKLVLEIIDSDNELKSIARRHWQEYKQLGLHIIAHDLATEKPTES